MATRTERRKTTRRNVDLVADPKSGADGSPRRVNDLSLDGLRLDGALPVAAGGVVRLALHVPDARRPLRVRGVVVDSGADTRVAFVGLTTRKRVRIAEYLFG